MEYQAFIKRQYIFLFKSPTILHGFERVGERKERSIEFHSSTRSWFISSYQLNITNLNWRGLSIWLRPLVSIGEKTRICREETSKQKVVWSMWPITIVTIDFISWTSRSYKSSDLNVNERWRLCARKVQVLIGLTSQFEHFVAHMWNPYTIFS